VAFMGRFGISVAVRTGVVSMPARFPCSVMPWRSAKDCCCSLARLDRPRLKAEPSLTSRRGREDSISEGRTAVTTSQRKGWHLF
jgi:hypothetical protein